MRKMLVIIGLLSVLLAIVLASLNLQHGNLNQDEGWYLYAAKQVAEGKTPYADFAFTQGPVLPFVYALFYPIVESNGVVGGRLLTTIFGLLSALLAAGVAFRVSKANRAAVAIAAFLLIGANVYQSYFTTIVKTYGLCSFFLMAGFFILSFRHSRLLGGCSCFFAGAFLALAAATRLSAGIVLPVVGIWLIIRSFKDDLNRDDYSSYGQYLGHKLSWLCFGLGGGFVLLLVFAPLFVKYPEQISFGLFGYHAGRDPGGFSSLLMLKAGFVSRFVQAYFLFAVLTLATLFFIRRSGQKGEGWIPLLWISGVAISLVHFMAPFPYDDYQAIAYPLLGAALALTIMQAVKPERVSALLAFLLLASMAAAFSSPVNQDWFVRGRDRIWWRLKEKSDIETLQEVAQYIRANSSEGSTLLTQDTYLAVEANRAVPHGMGMGPFCYYPDMPREQAEKFHLLNREMLVEVLAETDAPLAAFSGYGLAIESPSIVETSTDDAVRFASLLTRRYLLDKEIFNFGQAHTTLDIYKQKDVE